jgi:hypothetical protein
MIFECFFVFENYLIRFKVLGQKVCFRFNNSKRCSNRIILGNFIRLYKKMLQLPFYERFNVFVKNGISDKSLCIETKLCSCRNWNLNCLTLLARPDSSDASKSERSKSKTKFGGRNRERYWLGINHWTWIFQKKIFHHMKLSL